MRLAYRSLVVSLFLLAGLTACASRVDDAVPKTAADTQPAFIHAEVASGQTTMSGWWQHLDDPLLNDYVARLLDQNLDLQAAQQRIAQMQAGLGQQQAADYPALSLSGSASRAFSPNVLTGQRQYSNSYGLQFNSSWEADLFGKRDAAQQAADAGFQASRYDHQALQQALIAQLVQLRLELAVNQQLQQLAQQKREQRQRLLHMQQRRYRAGAGEVSSQTLLAARQELHRAEADVEQYQRVLTGLVYQLDVLLGQPPGTTQPLTQALSMILPELNQAVCVPASLLDRRPDLRASELRLQAANANIHIALADLYPSLALSAGLGVSAASRANLLRADKLLGSLVANVMATLFDGGRRQATIALQQAKAEELALAYAGTVLNAMREVETQLQAEQNLTQERQKTAAALQQQQLALSMLQQRYRRGIVSAANMLEAELGVLQNQQQRLTLLRAHWQARIGLYQALGGDWLGQKNNKVAECTKGLMND